LHQVGPFINSKKLIVTKVEQHSSTGQSPQRAVAQMEEEEELGFTWFPQANNLTISR